MPAWWTSPSDDDPRLAAFEHAPEPVFVTEGERHGIVAANAAARAVLGGRALEVDLAEALPALGPDQLDCWSQARRSPAPVVTRVVLEAAGGALTFDVHLQAWAGRHGHTPGVVARLRPVSDEAAVLVQEAGLLEELPVLPRVDLAATYLLAERAGGAGGDWFDVVRTPGGAVALVMGDVVGRGTAAVTTTAALRAVLCEHLRTGSSITDALHAAEGLADELPAASASTVVLVLLEPDTGALTYCTAGHPPPLVVDPDGSTRTLPPSGGGCLGSGVGFPTGADVLQPGQLLLLHSDGLTTRPARTADQCAEELAEAAHAVFARHGGGHGIRGTAGRVCEQVLAGLVGETGSADDIVLLAAERMPDTSTVDLVLPAAAPAVRAVRTGLADWLDELRAGDLDTTVILHAVGELVSNAVEHAYAGRRPGPGDGLVVDATLSPSGDAVVSVTDHGRWRTARPGGRGRGLAMARGLVDRLEVDRRTQGTTVTVRHRIGRPVTMFRGRAPDERHGTGAAEFRTTDNGPGRVTVHGRVDGRSVETLRVELLHRTRGGTAPLVVDLGPVMFLGRLAVPVLAEALGWSQDGADVVLVAPPGTPAHHVLTTLGFPCAPS